jgi:peptide-methionine (R)-S-oxide reductase
MLNRRYALWAGAGALALFVGDRALRGAAPQAAESFAVTHTDAEWRGLLTPAAYQVLRLQGTERAFSSPLDHETRSGIFACAGCDQPLYSSKTKYDSHTGWPSFWQPLAGAVGTSEDTFLAMKRTEVHCSRCGGHLGHVFDDGPAPTGLRYCMNGVALAFHPGSA